MEALSPLLKGRRANAAIAPEIIRGSQVPRTNCSKLTLDVVHNRMFCGFPKGVSELATLVNVISATRSGAMSTLNCLAYLMITGVRIITTTSFKINGEKMVVTTTTA